jgi:hypothetical protein
MRTWGRVGQVNGVGGTWTEVSTDPTTGDNSYVWLTTLVQVLKLGRNESPFYANWGIPAQQSVVQQVFPDLFVALTQQQFAPYFASLIVAKVPAQDVRGVPYPNYRVNVTLLNGAAINPFNVTAPATMQIPT